MAHDRGSQLMALFAVTSFIWLSFTLEKHALSERPRLSSFLILFICGVTSFVASFFSSWLPGAQGRFDDDAVLLKGATPEQSTNLPQRPRRYFFPALVLCVSVRLEIFHQVTYNLQCSSSGIQLFLPFVLLCYGSLPGGRGRSHDGGDDEDLSLTMYDDLIVWLQGSPKTLLLQTLIFCCGAYLAAQPTNTSTLFCSPTDSRSSVVFLQVLGLILDGAITIMLWRILTWTRTIKSRLKTLSTILLTSSLAVGAMLLSRSILNRSQTPFHASIRGLDSLYFFDVVIDGFTFSSFIIFSSLAVCESSPVPFASTVVFLCGLLAALHKITLIGTFELVSKATAVVPLSILCLAFSVFVYSSRMRSVLFIRRVFLIGFLACVLIASLIYALAKKPALERHPVDKLVYDGRIEADRWLIHATVSKTLRVAVEEYKDRHHGRDPPPGFDLWYNFALERNSVIIDHFQQMEADISPFWGRKAASIREDADKLKSEPDIAILSILKGVVSHSQPSDPTQQEIMDDLVDLVRSFSHHIPDMQLAINLNERPRVIAPFDDVKRLVKAGRETGYALLSRRLAGDDAMPAPGAIGAEVRSQEQETGVSRALFPSDVFEEMSAIACPPGSEGRSGVHWNTRDFCSDCARPQSYELYLADWSSSQELCHQPDLMRLHGFFMSPSTVPPTQDLVPIFSRSKASSFNDILIPLSRGNLTVEGESTRALLGKADRLYWRGVMPRVEPSHHFLRGGHQGRLAHLINNASSESVTILLPSRSDRGKFLYEDVPIKEINAALPIDVGFSDDPFCTELGCELMRQEFGTKEEAESTLNRYIILADSDDGPSLDTVRILRSTSLPFIASIFKEWYTERLMPWVHFVPIDLRYHALHSTLSYFTGMKARGFVNGRDPEMFAHLEDAGWIADQGRRWAEKAMRREDMEVYMFRLLLEWGRVIHDKRDELGFKLEKS